MNVTCNECGKPMKKRKNFPFGRSGKYRLTYYCKTRNCNGERE